MFKYQRDFSNSLKRIRIYAQNKGSHLSPTFMLTIQRHEKLLIEPSIIEDKTLQQVVTVILITMLFICLVYIIICCRNTWIKGHPSKIKDFDVDNPHPEWDQDQLRAYHIVQMENKIKLLEGDLTNKRYLELKLKEAKDQNIKCYIDSLEYLNFKSKEHTTT